jgi:Domain of unknown function (DUF4249)
MAHRYSFLLFLLPLFAMLTACNPQLDVFAPEKELYSVYGVLDPNLDSNYVRIGRVFQVNSDAYVYAAGQDLQASDLAVTLEGGGKTYIGQLDDYPPKDSGLFHPGLSLYRFDTPPSDRLEPGVVYTLHVRHRDDDLLHITAETRIPYNPRLISPGPYIYSPVSGQYTFNTVEFNDDVSVTFEKGEEEGYELRVWIKYWDGEKMAEFRWGPSRIEFESDGCAGSVFYNRTCYKIGGKSLPTSFAAAVAQSPGIPYMVDTVRVARSLDALSADSRLELTVVDKHLARFLNSVTPFGYGLNLLLDKSDYTNISGGNPGIFGAIQRKHHAIFLGSCTLYHAGLQPTPSFVCD